MLGRLIERLFEIKVVRAVVATIIFLRGAFFVLTRNIYRASVDYCWLYRVSDIEMFKNLARRFIMNTIHDGLKKGENPILANFLNNSAANRAREKYSLSSKGSLNLFRDVIVLKESTIGEKGVLLIKYTPTFDAFLAFVHLEAVLKEYYIVLEPSWVGACDPSILMFVSSSGPVIVQTPEMSDYDFIAGLDVKLHPIFLGSGDWVDAELFSVDPFIPKKYDLILVANWGRIKRHTELFRALDQIKTRPIKVVLIGFPWGGRTKENIKAEMNRYDLQNAEIEILENLQAKEVSKYLNQSKVFVLLSKKEGPNKAIVEGFFANVPALLYENFIGGAKAKINPQTGILSSYEDLPEKIEYILDHYQEFSPRAWALQNTGSRNAILKLNSFILEIANKNSEKWTTNLVEKINVPNLAYKDRQMGDSALVADKLMQKYLRSAE